RQPFKRFKIINKTMVRWVSEFINIMNIRGRWLKRTFEHLLQVRLVKSGTQPVNIHMFSIYGMILLTVNHGESLSKGFSKFGIEPFFIVLDISIGSILRFNKIIYHFGYQV